MKAFKNFFSKKPVKEEASTQNVISTLNAIAGKNPEVVCE